MTVTVNCVNDSPSFTPGSDVTVLEDSGAYSAAWASAISLGPSNESGQTVTFHVSNDNNSLFSSQPAISAVGTLTFTPANDANGSATVDVYLKDDGGASGVREGFSGRTGGGRGVPVRRLQLPGRWRCGAPTQRGARV